MSAEQVYDILIKELKKRGRNPSDAEGQFGKAFDFDGSRHGWISGQCLSVSGFRILKTISRMQEAAKVIMGFCMVWLDVNGLAEEGARFECVGSPFPEIGDKR